MDMPSAGSRSGSIVPAILKIRRDTEIAWYQANPVLKEGEMGFVTSGANEGKFKVGDAVTPWRTLPYTTGVIPPDVLKLSLAEQSSHDIVFSGSIKQLFQAITNFLGWVKGLFDGSSGHKHDGIDSPRIALEDVDGVEALSQRIDGVENLGHYVGAFDAFTSLSMFTINFPNGISVNDFATIRADETHGGAQTRYVVSAINDGEITWVYDITYTTDISGKVDKVAGAVGGNFPAFGANGNLVDSGQGFASFATAAQGAKADTALQSLSVGSVTTGSAPDVQVSGDPLNPSLDFVFPAGGGSGGGGIVGGNVETFTFVIDSDAALADWVTNAPGNDYSRVLIKSGTWTYTDNSRTEGGTATAPLGVINLGQTRTDIVVGESTRSKLVVVKTYFTNLCHCACILGSNSASVVGYAFMKNVSVEFNPRGEGYAYGFFNCSDLTNCTVKVDPIYPSNNWIVAYGFAGGTRLINCVADVSGYAFYNSHSSVSSISFYNCTFLVNCHSKASCRLSTGSSVYGTSSGDSRSFVLCEYLINCRSGSSVTGYGNAYGFYQCKRLTNCVGVASGNGSNDFVNSNSISAYGFYQCEDLNGCLLSSGVDFTATATLYGNAYGFYQCKRLTNCSGEAFIRDSSNRQSLRPSCYGFVDCSDLTNCTASVRSPVSNETPIVVFWSCRGLINCSGYVSIVVAGPGTIRIGYVFSGCFTGFGCRGSMDVSASPVFHNCYMEQGTGVTPWSDTAAGGYNLA